MHRIKNLVVAFAIAAMLLGCKANGDNPGREYAPNMYHSVAYEPYTQITDKDAGRWLTSIDYPDGHAEFYNSNNFNPFRMNMREPAPNTVSRNSRGWLPYRLPNNEEGLRQSNELKNPFEVSSQLLSQGKILYETYCDHCHGAKGEGDGKVADKYAGVPNYKSDALINMTEGHIFHVITHGKGLMKPHASQVTPEERWIISSYVKTLQK
jgi:mono/diheme cytochrome c family protein